jgi:plastocyanin
MFIIKTIFSIFTALILLLTILLLLNNSVFSVPLISAQNNSTATAQRTTDGNITIAKNNVSIVSDAAAMEDKAFSPDPVDVKVGDTVLWTNNDISTHTVTEGNPDSIVPPSGFDSGLLSQNQTFSHTFNKPGPISYFCQLHPQMVGKVIVSS